MMIPKITPILTAEPRLRMTALERAVGRFMRSPDGHDAGGDAGTSGDIAGTGEGEGDAGDATVLGGASSEGGEGQEGAADKGEGGKGGGEAAASGAPEKYELTPSEGFDMDPEALALADPVFRDLNLSNEQAQKLMPVAEAFAARIMEKAQTSLTETAANSRKEWNDAYEADPEIGGANKAKTEAAAAKAFDHYGLKKGEGLRQLLDESGLGNHPDLIRFVSGVGRDLAEGTFERGGAATTPKTPEQKLYGDEFQPKS